MKREEVIQHLVQHWFDCNLNDKDIMTHWLLNGLELVGFNNMTDEELAEEYADSFGEPVVIVS